MFLECQYWRSCDAGPSRGRYNRHSTSACPVHCIGAEWIEGAVWWQASVGTLDPKASDGMFGFADAVRLLWQVFVGVDLAFVCKAASS